MCRMASVLDIETLLDRSDVKVVLPQQNALGLCDVGLLPQK